MARLRKLDHTTTERQSLHKEADGGWRSFDLEGTRILQIDTYGTDSRDRPGQVSQSLQLDEQKAQQVVDIIRRTFPEVG